MGHIREVPTLVLVPRVLGQRIHEVRILVQEVVILEVLILDHEQRVLVVPPQVLLIHEVRMLTLVVLLLEIRIQEE